MSASAFIWTDAEVRSALGLVAERTGPLATAEDGRVCIEMILGAYRAAREGRRVHFPFQD